ncbi:L-histidine N(alpha)-methyltransferase [Epilithonimonas ginsengisoli]|uniref:L-histidine N(Alpha)-methyltransferase n=1 Tax=Epilithonimonas ginsengisoli TaxID=1245592 RepID=A0ABU4JJ39_9FLAO|nr:MULTISPECIES: L-histidine N(alpha)-methyltransferase [Chryseobacterium group]MBV6880230.1 L-histidine N(alpha)-methyltransferase [Epilithonimonas sp. FP105]MDW8549682.1 L-histidine N(alpha)-methyltransferase [Epilithonimonas ginsengisoli]OAH72236.1 dimethylhistidine N-methyltransferase [Chryseobacterium sp. FP211-J200]
MNSQVETEFQTQNDSKETFLLDVIEGLQSSPKRLHSKYFYDKAGDQLFQQIMNMPEYYLTDCELDIFKNKTELLAKSILIDNKPFDLIELGAGDAMKSSYLLEHLTKKNIDFTYMPIDISGHILEELSGKFSRDLPDLEVKTLEGDYFDMLDKAMSISQRRKVVLFLGGNIGNMDMGESYHFCRELRRKLNRGDILLVGFDLKKNPHTILNAYNDEAGITSSFNLNLLIRMNRELEADFDVLNFQHYQTYDPISGVCKSYLVSLAEQNVHMGNQIFRFEENELIDMEISQKFSQEDISKLARDSKFHIIDEIHDSKNWFVDSIWQIL